MENTSDYTNNCDPNINYRKKKMAQILGSSGNVVYNVNNTSSTSTTPSTINGRVTKSPSVSYSDIDCESNSTIKSRQTLKENGLARRISGCDDFKSQPPPHLLGHVDYMSVIDRVTIRRKLGATIHILPDAPKRIYLPAMSYTTPRREALTGSSNFPTLRSSHHSRSSKCQRSEEALPRMSSSQDSKHDGLSNSPTKLTTQSAATLNEYFDRRQSAPTKSRVASKYFRLPENDNKPLNNRTSNPSKPVCNGLDQLNSSLQLAMNNNFKNGL